MNKTYSAPELIKVELLTAPMMSVTSFTKDDSDDNAVSDGQLSKGFSGSLWDDGDAEDN